jgi:Ca2+-binding EF-hand superfamily protein
MTAAPLTDYQDYVFLASTRPVLLRLHLRIDGRPYYAAWDDYMKKLFAYFDRDGNGALSKEELERLPNPQFLQNHLSGAIGNFIRGQTARFAEADADKDGKVTLEEFKAYYRKGGFAPLRFFANSNQASADAVTGALFNHLDANKDGKLSAEELARAPEVLQRLDADEDEMITQAELAPDLFGNRRFAGFVNRPRMAPAARGEGPALLEVRPGEPPDRLVRELLARYDKDRDGKLSLAELGIDKAAFDALDANHDGRLDQAELTGFFRRDADLELMLRAGKVDPKGGLVDQFLKKVGVGGSLPARAEVFNPKGRAMPLAALVKRVDGDTVSITLGDALFEVQASGNRQANFQGVRQFYLQQYQMLKGDKKFVERKQAMQNQFVNELFNLADRDGDGKLYEKELTAYLDLQAEGSGCSAALSAGDQGRSLFDLLDADHDGRLSVRELRNAWAQVKPLARDPAGLARGDIPRNVRVALGQGGAFFRAVRPAGPRSKPAPLWFTKMDRNNDGDVSPREFLGTLEDFRRLDLDGDGLISAEEARQADARLNKEKKPEVPAQKDTGPKR